ncbi:thiolase domain-containing protein [Aquihabitans sp. McL0605]|uniref:thiolase domain-containing protein n=1 Tax=Aquihabitans sp. McL0605 TaxID=3415671 RepID=UPI003CF6EC95
MGHERVAVVGIGQTKHEATRGDVSVAGLLREAAGRALADAEMTWSDVDAVVIGKAPDFFEGVMMPELFLADALGCTGKPMFRVHTAGSVGGSTAIVASQLIAAGIHERVLTVAFEKQSESEAMWALSLPIPFTPPLHAGAGGYFAPHIRSYIRRSKAPDHVGMLVALKDRQNGLKNPYAHLHEHDISFDSIKESMMLWDPIRYAETCPSSDGACALVLGSEKVADEAAAQGRKPAWIQGTAMRSEPTLSAERDTVLPLGGALCAADVYKQAGITNPRKDVDAVEMYVPFSWFEPMWLENLGFAEPGEGWKMTEDGVTALDGDLPVNMSGGVLCTNPIGASGMLRFAEAAMQVRGTAGEHQVDSVRKAVGHAYGGGSQFFAMWVVGKDKP